MKRREFIRHLAAQGCRLVREGANHSWWENASEERTWTFNSSLEAGRYKAVPTHYENMPYIHVFEHASRGAAGYGEFYILRSLSMDQSSLNATNGFELVGVCDGSGYEVKKRRGKLIVATGYPMSFGPIKSISEWKGRFFEPVK